MLDKTPVSPLFPSVKWCCNVKIALNFYVSPSVKRKIWTTYVSYSNVVIQMILSSNLHLRTLLPIPHPSVVYRLYAPFGC